MRWFFLLLCVVMGYGLWRNNHPVGIGVRDGHLRPCPSTPNCATMEFSAEGRSWSMIVSTVERLPRTQIVTQSESYIHAECRSRIFGFVDDLEILLLPKEERIQLRSASRVGYGDMGVNQERLKEFRRLLGEPSPNPLRSFDPRGRE